MWSWREDETEDDCDTNEIEKLVYKGNIEYISFHIYFGVLRGRKKMLADKNVNTGTAHETNVAPRERRNKECQFYMH